MRRRAWLRRFGRAALALAFCSLLVEARRATAAGGAGEAEAAGRTESCDNPRKLTATLRIGGTDADLRALLIALRYPDGKLSIPGRGNTPSVAARIKALNGSAKATPNDTDGALKARLTSSASGCKHGALSNAPTRN